MTPKSKVALFPGTFNPFTIGHLRIVTRALKFADKVIVAIGYNINKGTTSDMENRIKNIKSVFKDSTQVEVTSYSGLTAEFAAKAKADFIIRGVRDVKDFEYERNLADINLKLLGIETVFLCAEPEYSYISSSAIRELSDNGFDVTTLLP